MHGEDGFGGDAPPHILAGALGDFTGGLSSAARPALGNSFTDVAGVYLLDHGHVHFPGVEFPALPARWAYETWTIIDGVQSSLGRFGAAEGGEGHDEHDHDTPAPEAGKGAALQHLVPSTDVRGGALLITIEPAPDDSPLPYSLPVLEAEVPTDAKDGAEYALTNASASFTSGVATAK